MKIQKWWEAVISVAVAIVAFVIFGIISYKFIGAAGIVGIIVILAALFINGYIIKKEDDLPGGFNNPILPPIPDKTKPPDPDNS